MKPSPSLLLRVGLAFGFLYAAVAAFDTPENWIGFIPQTFVQLAAPVASGETLLVFFSVGEILLAFWLLWGRRADLAALASSALLLGIVLGNWGAMDIVFRDIGLLFAALALFALSRP